MKTLHCILAFLLFAALSAVSSAATYRAHDPAWRGVWLWQRNNHGANSHLVDMRAFVESHPGACQLSLVNRIAGRSMGGGLDRFYVRIADGYGNLLYPAAERSRVLHFDNWGLDFGAFDYVRAWADFGARTGCFVAFAGPEEELAAFRAKYPELECMPLADVPKDALKGAQVNSEALAERNLGNVPLEFRRVFTLESAPVKALLCITATGSYEVSVNGAAVGRDGDWILSETYDVTELLKAGENTISVDVDPDKELPGLIVNANITLADGSEVHVDTDRANWLCRKIGSSDEWKAPVPVGFEGAGPRFRLREAFKYPAKTLAPRPESIVKAGDCANLSSAASDALGGVTQANAGEYVLEMAEPALVREVRFKGTDIEECRVYGRGAADGEWIPVAPAYRYGERCASSYRSGVVNVPFSPVRVQALKVVFKTTDGTEAPLERLVVVRSDEE